MNKIGRKLNNMERANFYINMLERIGLDTIHCNATMLPLLQECLKEKEIGQQNAALYFNRLREIIGKDFYEMEIDDSYKTNKNQKFGFMFSLKGNLEDMKSKIKEYFIKTEKEEEPTPSSQEMLSKWDLNAIEKIWKIYTYYYEQFFKKGNSGISLDQIGKILGLHNSPQKDSVDSWISRCKKILGVPAGVTYGVSTIRSNTYTIYLHDVKNVILTIGEKMREKGYDYDAEKVLHMSKIDEPVPARDETVSEIIARRLANASSQKKEVKKSTLIRMSMTLSEIQEYFPTAILKTSFVENDNIFEISYEKSFEGIVNLCRLSEKMSGTDMFFDDEIVSLITGFMSRVNEFLAE